MTVRIFYLGVAYDVAPEMPVVRALESAGIAIRHGSGCRQGFCGACAMLYRLPGSSRLHGGLACQTPVRDGMDICRLPRIPVHRESFDVRKAEFAEDLLSLYPELDDCTRCGACNEICPVEIDVMGTVKALQKKRLGLVAELANACVSCDLCTVRCPAEITPSAVAIQALRVVGYVNRASERVEECVAGSDASRDRLAELCALGADAIRRDIATLRAEAEAEIRRRSP